MTSIGWQYQDESLQWKDFDDEEIDAINRAGASLVSLPKRRALVEKNDMYMQFLDTQVISKIRKSKRSPSAGATKMQTTGGAGVSGGQSVHTAATRSAGRRVTHNQATTTTKGKAVWEFNDRGSWKAYAAADAQKLEQVFHTGTKTTNISNRFGTYACDMAAMQQTNLRTGTVRKIRRRVAAGAGGGGGASSQKSGSAVAHLTDLGSVQKLIASSTNRLVVIDFFASWCGPCKWLAPKFEQIAREFPSAAFAKVDASKNAGVQSTYGIRSFPAIKFFKGGQEVAYVRGANPARIRSETKRLLSQATTTTTTTTTKSKAVWEFDDRGSWKAYAAADAQKLEQAFHTGTKTTNISNRFGTYACDVAAMQQTNLGTGTVRKIRRRVAAGAGGGGGASPQKSGSAVAHLTDLGSVQKLIASSTNRLVVIDFFASWCGPCKWLAPKFEQIAREFPSAAFAKVDASKNAGVQSTYGIRSFPAIKFFKGGKEVAYVRGANPARIRSETKRLLSQATTTTTTKGKAVWEFDDRGSWKAYAAADAQKLEQAFHTATKTTNISNRFGMYACDVASMQQTNMTTGTVRKIRRRRIAAGGGGGGGASPQKSGAVWEWYDGSAWNAYSPSIGSQIEASSSSGKRFVRIDIGGGRIYEIDFGTKQQRNLKTGFFRRVRRRQGGPGGAAVGIGSTSSSSSSSASSKTTSSAGDHDDLNVPKFPQMRADEIDCWKIIAPIRAKHNPRMLTKNPIGLITKACQAGRKKFVDRQFPPSKLSANWNPQRKSAIRYAAWKRIGDIAPGQPSVFGANAQPDPDDVIQGRLGNCWFLQCLSALATRPRILRHLITPRTFSKEGVYTVKVFDEGKWHYVVVDDYVPIQGSNNYLSCARSRDPNVFWVELIEKAYAKLHTCYQSMVGGSNTYCFGPSNVLRMMTASPTVDIRTNKKTVDQVWTAIHDRASKGYIIGCGTRGAGGSVNQDPLSHQAKAMGLVPGHAYSVLGTIVLDPTSASPTRLVRVRNTWGSKEWTGDFSDRDKTNWTFDRHQQVVAKFGSFNAKNDGIFFIKVEDFHRFYDVVYAADIVGDSLKHSSIAHTVFTKNASADPEFEVHFNRAANARGTNATIHVEMIVSRKDYDKIKRPSVQFVVAHGKTDTALFTSDRVRSRNLFGSCSVSANAVVLKPTLHPARSYWGSGNVVRFSLVARADVPFRLCRRGGTCQTSAPHGLSLKAMNSGTTSDAATKTRSLRGPIPPPATKVGPSAPSFPSLIDDDGRAAIWEWATDDHRTFAPYDSATTAAIERAFRAREPAVSIHTNDGRTYVIDFRAMHQTSSRGFHRAVRRREDA